MSEITKDTQATLHQLVAGEDTTKQESRLEDLVRLYISFTGSQRPEYFFTIGQIECLPKTDRALGARFRLDIATHPAPAVAGARELAILRATPLAHGDYQHEEHIPIALSCGMVKPGSLCLDTRELDHLGPLLDFRGNEHSEIAGRAGKRRRAQIGKSRTQLRISEARIDFCVEFLDDLGGCILSRAKSKLIARVVARQEVGHSWDVGQRLQPRCGGRRQRAQLGVADVLD